MPRNFTFEGRKDHYRRLWETMELRQDKIPQLNWHVEKIIKYRDRYNDVQIITGVPWWFVGLIHAMEASYNFKKHLHNGDPLTARTRRVPRGRPLSGVPPFTWSASACDALEQKDFHKYKTWRIDEVCYRLEIYNGTGYALYRNIETPYLWSYTNHYTRGKYVSDGRYSASAVSAQAGACAILKLLAERVPEIKAQLYEGAPISAPVPVKKPKKEEAVEDVVLPPDPVEEDLDLLPQPKAEPVPPTRQEMAKSRKWSLMECLKWIAGFGGLGGLTLDLGSASGVQSVKDYADAVVGFIAAYGLTGAVAICAVIALIATALQRMMEEDVAEQRYVPSGERRDVDDDPAGR